MDNIKITSSGIIRNASKPRVGVASINRLESWVFDEIDRGIDLSFEEFLDELRERGIEEDSTEWYRETDHYENDGGTILFGDAWYKCESGKDKGKYLIDPSKNYAAEYSRDSGNISVNWSKVTVKCGHTSPCYVMADGSGPCGDLDAEGDSVVAYTLPLEFFVQK